MKDIKLLKNAKKCEVKNETETCAHETCWEMKVNRIGPNLNNKWSIENVRHLKILNGEDCDFLCLYKIYTVGHLKQVCNDSHALNSGIEHSNFLLQCKSVFFKWHKFRCRVFACHWSQKNS